MENQEFVKRLKRWQMAKNPCVFSLHCRNAADPHPDVFSTLEPREVKGKVVLCCPDCDYTQEEIPDFVLKALEAKVISHPHNIEPSMEAIEEFSELSEEDIRIQAKDMVSGTGLPHGVYHKYIELLFRRGLKQELGRYRKLKKIRNLSNTEKISRVNQWQQNSSNIHDYDMRCYSTACNNVLSFSKLKPEEVSGRVVLICPDCGYIQERVPDYVLLAFE